MKSYEKKVNEKVFCVESFDSVLEFERIVGQRQVSEDWKEEYKYENDERISSKSNWYGVSSKKEAYDLLKNGWQIGTEKALGKLQELRNSSREKTTFKNDVVGFCPNVPLSLMNVPNSMINVSKRSVKNKVLNIVYFNSVSWTVKGGDMIKAGVNVVNALLDVEKSGYRVNLNVATAYCERKAYVSMVNVKSANQSLNLLKMMFPLANPAWLRVIGFDWLYKSKAPYMDGNGIPIYRYMEKNGLDIKDVEKLVFGDNTVYIDYKMAEKGTEYVKEVLKRKM